MAIAARVDGHAIPAQVDVKTRHPDGSAWISVVTMEAPSLPPGASAGVMLTAAPPGPKPAPVPATPSGLTVTVLVQAADGSVRRHSYDLDRSDAVDAPGWLDGPLVTERRVVIPVEGSLRVVADLRSYAAGSAADITFANDVAFRPDGGTLFYEAVISRGGRELFRTGRIRHFEYQTWHKLFDSWPGAPPHIVHDVRALARSGLIHPYDFARGVSPALLGKERGAMRAPGWGAPLSDAGVTRDMYGTGGRPDIGPTTLGNTVWLLSQDADAEAFALGQADASGSVPWHVWDGRRGHWVSVLDEPSIWLDPRGGPNSFSTGLPRWLDKDSGWSVDTSHQPDLSFVPYLLTGRRSTLDQLNAQAAWSVASHWPAAIARSMDQGLVVQGHQVRGAAWSLRAIDEAAWANPDGSADKAYFSTIARRNWEWLAASLPKWSREQGEPAGRVPGEYGQSGTMAPWQQDYFASTVAQAVGFGVPQARLVLDWQANFLVGRFTQPRAVFNPRDGAAYNLMTRMPDGQACISWAALGQATVAAKLSNGDGWEQSQGDYGALALASLAEVANALHRPDARAAYVALLRSKPPYTGVDDFAKDPTFAIVPSGTDKAER